LQVGLAASSNVTIRFGPEGIERKRPPALYIKRAQPDLGPCRPHKRPIQRLFPWRTVKKHTLTARTRQTANHAAMGDNAELHRRPAGPASAELRASKLQS